MSPASTADDLDTSRGYLPRTVSHPCGLKVTDRLTDVSVDILHVLAGTVLVRAVSCPGLHPTVDRLVVACGSPDWVGALKRVQGESCPGLHPTVDPLAGWPKASDEHVLKQTALTPSFARGSRLQTTPKGRKEQATCQGPPGQPERTCCAVKRMAIKGRPSAIAISPLPRGDQGRLQTPRRARRRT